jgi:hypothetical protein
MAIGRVCVCDELVEQAVLVENGVIKMHEELVHT